MTLDGLDARLAADGLEHWRPIVPDACTAALGPGAHGRLDEWLGIVDGLPSATDPSPDYAAPAVRIGHAGDLDAERTARLREGLLALAPWRKGPFSLFGVEVDAEWRSDLKWDRLAAAVDFAGARVLDVGCGNGYYAFRMLGAGARRVIGVDPTLLHGAQFAACARFLDEPRIDWLPLPGEALPGGGGFDVVCSLGVLYHRRSPIDHLAELKAHLDPGGTLAVESIVVPGDAGTVLCPPGRYARMRNVWFLPSAALMVRWLERLGLADVRIADESPTTTAEQRPTDFMRFESLAHTLDPDDPLRTVEGHPAPRRALVVARRP
jgi:tRNA (mo5U34)-methyltransferase